MRTIGPTVDRSLLEKSDRSIAKRRICLSCHADEVVTQTIHGVYDIHPLQFKDAAHIRNSGVIIYLSWKTSIRAKFKTWDRYRTFGAAADPTKVLLEVPPPAPLNAAVTVLRYKFATYSVWEHSERSKSQSNVYLFEHQLSFKVQIMTFWAILKSKLEIGTRLNSGVASEYTPSTVQGDSDFHHLSRDQRSGRQTCHRFRLTLGLRPQYRVGHSTFNKVQIPGSIKTHLATGLLISRPKFLILSV